MPPLAVLTAAASFEASISRALFCVGISAMLLTLLLLLLGVGVEEINARSFGVRRSLIANGDAAPAGR